MAGTGISFHVETVTRIRAPYVDGDRYGDEVRDWDNATETTVSGGRLLPMVSAEDTIDREQIVRRWLYFAPPDADWLASDRLRWQGVVYEIDGEVRRWPSPTGRLAHLEIDLLLVEG